MRKREAIQPRKSYRAKADTFSLVAGSNTGSVCENTVGFAGVRERGEHTKVVQAYLGDLAVSAETGGRHKRSLVNGVRPKGCQKSD